MNPSEIHPAFDRVLTRRRALALLGAGGAATLLAACGSDATGSTTAATAGTAAAAVTGDLTATPEETGGPFPADGTNDDGEGTVANVLLDARSVRSDIRSDLDGSNTQDGVPFSLVVTVVDEATGLPMSGAAVYIWHCNRDGEYSEYNSTMLGGDFTDRSFLRGVQIADANGTVTFTTILPGRYQGRAFHIHFEVYGDATYDSLVLTSQMAMDDDLIDSLYAEAGYDEALANDTDNARDNIFGDGVDHQLLTVSGDVTSGLSATFTAVV